MQPIVVLVRRRGEDPKSTVSRFYRVRELDADREVKKQVSEESGLNDEDLPWVTVAHPFFECRLKEMYPLVCEIQMSTMTLKLACGIPSESCESATPTTIIDGPVRKAGKLCGHTAHRGDYNDSLH